MEKDGEKSTWSPKLGVLAAREKIVQAYMTLWIIENLTLKVLIISILIFVPTIIAYIFLISGRMIIHSFRIS